MNTWRSASAAVLATGLLTLTAACGPGQDYKASGQSAASPAPTGGGYGDAYGSGSGASPEQQGGAAGAAAKAAGQLAVWNSKKLGRVVTDSAGFTLYRFDKDTAKPPKSACAGACAKTWPVVAADGAKAAPGVDPELIGSVQRDDGTRQLTIGGWPMYRYAADKKPGEAKGQGVGGTWYAAAPDGKKAAPGGGQATPGAGGEAGGADGAAGSGAYGSGESGAYESGAGGSRESGAAAALPGMSTRKDPRLGEIVVDKAGMTVYRFKKDSAWPMKSACVGACLKKWPAVPPVPKNDVKGVVKAGFVVFARPDGVRQQTIGCWPVYTFSGDNKPGDTNGQGVGGTWYAVSPQGKLVGAPK